MKIEDAEWKPTRPPGVGRHPSQSTAVLRALKVGDTKRIIHDDISCKRSQSNPNCSLSSEIGRLRRLGWKLEYYHEKEHVIVIRRL